MQVIYGDTDSIMVNTRTRDRAACKKLADAIMRKVSALPLLCCLLPRSQQGDEHHAWLTVQLLKSTAWTGDAHWRRTLSGQQLVCFAEQALQACHVFTGVACSFMWAPAPCCR